MSDHEDGAGGQVRDVRVRRVLDVGGAEVERQATVFCEDQGHTITLGECMACPRCAGLRFDPAHTRAHVLCGGPMGPQAERTLPNEFRAGADEAPVHTPISAVMGADVVCIRRDLPFDSLARLLADSPVAAFPVIDDTGAPIGIVSRTDVFRRMAEEGDTNEQRSDTSELGPLGRGFHVERWAERTAADFMNPVVLALHEGASVAQACAFMAFEGIHQVPVLSDDRKVVGILCSLDVLRWVAHRSGYLVPARDGKSR
jgi:CBS domain-containing protein